MPYFGRNFSSLLVSDVFSKIKSHTTTRHEMVATYFSDTGVALAVAGAVLFVSHAAVDIGFEPPPPL